jgi:hypothetical protein
VAAKCDRLKVLYSMRDPVQRLWSHTKFHLQLTGHLDKLDLWGLSSLTNSSVGRTSG